MPFKETCPVEERIALFREYETGVFTVSDLCRRHGISRETFYVWKRRRESGEARWFEDRSHAVCELPACDVGSGRRSHHRGAAAVSAFRPEEDQGVAGARAPEVDWPAASTIGDILKREGLVEARRRRRRAIAQGEVVSPATAANEEWAIDFKGWFRTADGTRCDPLTITDAASRYLIEVRIVEPTWAGVRGAMERIFEDSRPARRDPLRQRIAVRLDGRGRALGAVGVVAEARHRAALHPAVEPAGQRPARAHAPHTEGRDLEAGSGNAGRAAARASTASAVTTTRSGRTRRSSRRRRPRTGSRRLAPCRRAWRIPGTTPTTRFAACALARHDQVARRAGVHRRGAGRRARRPRRTRERRPHRALLPSRPRGDRSRPPFPALCSAACAAPRRSGNGGDSTTMSEYCQPSARSKVSGISPVERRLSLSGPVTKSEFEAALTGLDPKTGERLAALGGRLQNHAAGWDMTFSAPKSVSVLWALSEGRERTAIEGAHRTAVASAMQHVERTAAWARRGKGGAVREPTAGLLMATFDHHTSRELDPQLHTHVFIFNLAPRK